METGIERDHRTGLEHMLVSQKRKKRSDTRVQLRMELQRPLLQVADRPEVIPDLARSSKPMLSSTVWRAREPQAEVDTIPTFWLSAFEASSMACQAQRA